MFIDRVTVRVAAGNGGSGISSFRREKFAPLGGPDGGDGGKGGDVIIRADNNLATLLDFTYRDSWEAERGLHGSGSNKTGASGSVSLTAALKKDFTKHLLYVNVHTAKNPAGEIRGQLGG